MDYLKVKELYHHGIKGQKWGIRRYQNEDGTLTEEGKAHYSTSSSDTSDAKENNKQKEASPKESGSVNSRDLAGKRIEDLTDKELQAVIIRRNNEKKLRESMNPKKEEPKNPEYDQALRDASRLAKDLADAMPKGNGKTIKKDYSGLTDQELSNRIRRLQLEDSYGKLSGDTIYVKSGSEKMREFLQTAGTALAVASSAATLAYTIKKLRKKDEMSQSDLTEAEDSLQHHGIKGQKWGFRRYQNEDGSLTAEGRARYGGKTHVSELTDRELADLEYEQERENKKKLAIGIGVTLTATAAILGAAYLAKKHQDMGNTKVSEVKAEIVDSKPKMSLHLAQPDTVKPNLLALPAPKASSSRPNIPDWLKKSGNGSKPVSSLINKTAVTKTIPKPSYDHRAVGAGVWANDKRKYSRYEFFKDSKGVNHKILKSELKSVPRIHINHFDCTDYLIFRAIYHSAFDELYHHGIKGQKWGVRRYQDEDGSLTPEGKRRYRTDVGTKDILDNSSKYYDLTKDQRKEYTQYGRISGAKRGFLIGAGAGALLGAGKVGLTYALAKPGERRNESGRSIVNTFTRNAMLGALGGSVVGTLIGSVAGKKTAQAELADKGRIYVDQLLATPSKRLKL